MLIHYYNIWDVSKWPLLFVSQLSKLEAVITYPMDHLFDSLSDQCFRQTFLSILVYSFHRFLYPFRNWDMFKCPGNPWNLPTVKYVLRFNLLFSDQITYLVKYYMKRLSKAICLHASKWMIS